MAEPRIYPNAPKTEALIQLLVQPPEGAAISALTRFHGGEGKSYGPRHEQHLR